MFNFGQLYFVVQITDPSFAIYSTGVRKLYQLLSPKNVRTVSHVNVRIVFCIRLSALLKLNSNTIKYIFI